MQRQETDVGCRVDRASHIWQSGMCLSSDQPTCEDRHSLTYYVVPACAEG